MKRYFISVLLAGSFITLRAQLYDTFFFVSWDVSQPFTNTDFAGSTSLAGLHGGYHKFLGDFFSAGLDIGSNTYDNYLPRTTIMSPGSAITTEYFNYLRLLSATASGAYYFRSEGKIIPYASLGLGVAYSIYEQYYNVYSANQAKLGFMARPGAGLFLRTRDYSSWGIRAGAHFDYASTSIEEWETNDFLGAGFQIGVVIFNE